jgi:predicted component of type VI protein secretion system
MAKKARKPKKLARPSKPRSSPYLQIYEGEWIEPAKRGFIHACCGCDLVHVTDYHVAPGDRVQFRTRVDRRLTAAARRAKKDKGDE